MSQFLVLHADDFGMSPAINRGIVQGFSHGLLTSTSILANAPAVDEATTLWQELELRRKHHAIESEPVRRILRDPELPFDLGAHLNLTQGRPLTANYPSDLLNQNGLFPGVYRLFYSLIRQSTPSLLKAIENELAAQIEFLLDCQLPIGHLNGHQYIELLPGIQEIVCRLALRYHVPAIRTAQEPGLVRNLAFRGRLGACLLAHVKKYFARSMRPLVQNSQLNTSEHYFGTADAGRIGLKEIAGYLRVAGGEFTEVGMHPGQPIDTTGQDLSPTDVDEHAWADPLSNGRPRELSLLMSPSLARLIMAERFQLSRIQLFRRVVGKPSVDFPENQRATIPLPHFRTTAPQSVENAARVENALPKVA